MAILSLILCVYGEKQFSREEVEFSEEEMGPDRHTTSIQLYMPDTLKGVKNEAWVSWWTPYSVADGEMISLESCETSSRSPKTSYTFIHMANSFHL